MKNKKHSGSFYTPNRLANVVVEYCFANISGKDELLILEPSVGDGSFVNSISNSSQLLNFKKINITAVEQDLDELDKVRNLNLNSKIKLKTLHSDYLDFHFSDKKKYSLFIGNPPYVKKSLLNEEQKSLCKKIHLDKNLSDRSINNIWTSFVISGISKVKVDGLIALILPLELLQVKFTEEIRTLLKESFERLEIFTFNELQFQECKGQDTVLIIGYKKHIDKGVFYTNIASLDDFENNKFEFTKNTALESSNKKWTHHLIRPEEYDFLENLKNKLESVSHYVSNSAGIVTAANNFFIINNETVEKYSLQKYVKPILQKGLFIDKGITFSADDFKNLIYQNKPCFLLDFNDVDHKDITQNLLEYLELGIKKDLHNGFKAKQRTSWYKVPNIGNAPEAFFFKRAHEYPKIVKNDANVRVTDSAYKIHMKTGYDLNNFIFSFYNSLTLTFAELEGRYYGGGVLELTPNEFRTLPVPYTICNYFENFENYFSKINSINEVLEQNNYTILNKVLGLNNSEINEIESIRKKLINKRQKKN
ncbi:N-6 DNA methylase [Flavobacterium sp. HBTb2-11-1]|uniref:Eco57I restriction-modification methylase domain-containing protein n=1 Tax=Flavobacterium sp. HBTb2-11-1 TaxID=2692212 RepID=UPI001371FC1D|nr:N-6 DNA methylase [Flavobacterium sp. HBTb2-11-1]MXO04372.1 N-6 DNA methylase [Flavobacterium sp. HBTb2-11-1]